MKKYFAKYLPVEGEMEDGDIYKSKFRVEHKFYHYVKFNKNNSTIPKDDFLGRHKLFLCSNDIEVGDEYISVDGSSIVKTLCRAKNSFLKGSYKIIGEISRDALLFVKEGDEFTLEEVKEISKIEMFEEEHFQYNEDKKDWDKVPIEQVLEDQVKSQENCYKYEILQTYLWKDAPNEIEVKFYYNIYKILCPTCKTYH